jgi:peptide/nickel transport system substrate-binding protein
MRNEERRGDPERGLTRREVVARGGAAAGAVSLGWLLAACGGGDEEGAGTGTATTGTAPAGGGEVDVVNWALTGDAPAIDYAKAYDFNTNGVVTNITEPLLLMNPQGELQPNLAEEWELTEPTTMVIKLRSGVKFHDGSEMTAEDVAFSLNRHRDPDVGSFLATFHDRVENVEATAPLDVTVTFTRPDAHFPYALATMAAAVSSRAFLEANGNKVGTPSVGIVGTGPYKFGSWTKGQEIVIDRFDDYWNTDRALKVKQLVSKILLDEATVVQALQTGEIDGIWGNNISGKGAKAVEAFENVNVTRGPSYGIHYLAMNTQKPPFDDPRVRQALSMAIDKAGLLESTWGGLGEAGMKSPAPPALWTFEQDTFQAAYDALPSFDLDLDGARALIADAGAEGAAGDILSSLPYDSEQAIAIQAAAEEIGLDLSPRKVEFTEKLTAELSGEPTRTYASTATQWASDIPDPAGQLFVLFHSKNLVTNNTAYVNPEVDDLLDRQRDSIDPAERAQLLTQAQAIIVEDQPDAIFYSPDTILVMNKRLTGYEVRPLWYWDPFAADLSGA